MPVSSICQYILATYYVPNISRPWAGCQSARVTGPTQSLLAQYWELLSQRPGFQAAALSHPQALDAFLFPVIIPVEFPQDDFEVSCLDHGDPPQVGDAVGSHHHGALIDQGTAANEEPRVLVQAAPVHPTGPPVDGSLPRPARPLGLRSSDVLSFPTDYGESTSSVI